MKPNQINFSIELPDVMQNGHSGILTSERKRQITEELVRRLVATTWAAGKHLFSEAEGESPKLGENILAVNVSWKSSTGAFWERRWDKKKSWGGAWKRPPKTKKALVMTNDLD